MLNISVEKRYIPREEGERWAVIPKTDGEPLCYFLSIEEAEEFARDAREVFGEFQLTEAQS